MDSLTNHFAHKVFARYFKAPVDEIVYLKAVLESYEGMAMVRTVTRGRPWSWLEILMTTDFKNEIEAVLAQLQAELSLEEIPRGSLPEPNHPEITLL